MTSTQVQFKIECDDKQILLVLDRAQEYVIMDWQSAQGLAQVMLKAFGHGARYLKPTDLTTTQWEKSQVKVVADKGKVAMLFDWSDRIKYTSLNAWLHVAQSLAKAAQDMELQEKDGVHLTYDEAGFIKAINNFRQGLVRRV